MKAPMEIMDSLESILSIFFYDIKQKERSVFILVDNLVELSCKVRLGERKKYPRRDMNLEDILKLANVRGELKNRLLKRRNERNTMQHELAAMTITKEHCADAIIDLCALIKNKLWGKYALDEFPEWINCALRIVKLYSRKGNQVKRKTLENYLEKYQWRSQAENEVIKYQPALENLGLESKSLTGSPLGRAIPKDNELIVTIGSTEHWTLLIKIFTEEVNSCLDELEIDDF